MGDFGVYSYMIKILTLISFSIISICMFAFSYYFQKVEKERISEIFYTISGVLVVISLALLGILLLFSKIIAPIDINSLAILILD